MLIFTTPQRLTAINFAVNFFAKLSSVGTVDVVDVVNIVLCVFSRQRGCYGRYTDYLSSILRATLT